MSLMPAAEAGGWDDGLTGDNRWRLFMPYSEEKKQIYMVSMRSAVS